VTDIAPLRVANCSGFYGDRLSAAREMIDGGPVDVLTGDWLAELTMLILAKAKRKDPARGYATTFVRQMEDVLGDCLARGIKVVTNAGGLAPDRCAGAVQELADRLGLSPVVAYVAGDDLLDRLPELRTAGAGLTHLDTAEELPDRPLVAANAYLGCWGIVEALSQGADVVITGRVTDASPLMGAAAWHFGWERTAWNELAGACAAGHVIECGCQATGGNFSFFTEVPALEHPGFPLAEMYPDGSSVITKHPGTGGLVSAETVISQLLYEISSARYLNPDVTALFDTIQLSAGGPDRVRMSGVRGEAPPPTLKAGLIIDGGYRNSITFGLTGLDIEAKADLVEQTLWSAFPDRQKTFETTDVRLIRTDRANPEINEQAVAELTITVMDPERALVDRSFSNVGIEMALASYPGFFAAGPPTAASSYGIFWPTLVPRDACPSEVVIGERRRTVPSTVACSAHTAVIRARPDDPVPAAVGSFHVVGGPTRDAPLGLIAGARSGDKAGAANVGIWARNPAAFGWLEQYLTRDRMAELFPEAATVELRRYVLPNLYALNFVFPGLLGYGVAANARRDPQAKGLGEYIRARIVPIPEALLGDARLA
jgi:Acyclic terpene utilisation family protein AtuA